LRCKKGKAFCERLFTLHRQQLENNKQNFDAAPPEKIPADAHARAICEHVEIYGPFSTK